MFPSRIVLPTALACSVTFVAAEAAARPAKIKVFEGIVRAEPKADAAVLERIPEGTEVSVDETAEDGWRRIRTSKGDVGWILEAALADVAPAVTPPAPTPVGVPSGGGGAPSYDRPVTVMVRQPRKLDTFGDLEEATASDPEVGATASELDSQNDTAWGVIIGSAVVSAGIMVGAVAAGPSRDNAFNEADYSAMTTWLIVGAVVGVVGMTTGYIIKPSDRDAGRVVDDWNGKHLDRPLEWTVPTVQYVYTPR